MSIVKMKKMQLFAHKEIRQRLLEFLQQEGVVQIDPLDHSQMQSGLLTYSAVSSQDIDETLQALRQMVAFLQKHSQVRIPGQILLDHQQWTQITQHFNFLECYHKCRQAEEDLNRLETKKQQLTSQRQQLVPWLTVGIRLQDLQASPYVTYLVGSLKQKKQDACLKKLQEEIPALHYEIISQDKDKTYLLIITLHEHQEQVLAILKLNDFSQYNFPKIKVTPKRLDVRLTQELGRIDKTLEHLSEEIKSLSQNLPKLVSLIDYYQNIRENKIVQRWFLESDKTFVITGWLPAKQEPAFRKALSQHFQEVELITTMPCADDLPPVEIENKKLIKPFEVITELYGYPIYTGIDPTIYLAPFFALFFGICLGDAGYGVVVAVIAAVLLWKMRARLNPGSWRFLTLFLVGGISTIIAGMAMGSWFGISVKYKLFDPLSQLMLFLGIALGLGVIHIFTGLLIKMKENIGDNGFWAGLWDQGTWILLIISLIVYGILQSMGFWPGIAAASAFSAIFSAGLIVLFQARNQDKNATDKLDSYQLLYLLLDLGITAWILKILAPLGMITTVVFGSAIIYRCRHNIKGFFARLGLGLYALYGFTSYFGDILSYSRLMALGLVGGIIAMVINIIAGIAKELIPGVGLLVAILILLAGHAFNLVMSMLSAFVHTARLQYLEFFNKFYVSGGKKFKPFNWTYKNVILTDNIKK